MLGVRRRTERTSDTQKSGGGWGAHNENERIEFNAEVSGNGSFGGHRSEVRDSWFCEMSHWALAMVWWRALERTSAASP